MHRIHQKKESIRQMKILITGASGFIGSFMVEHALTLGWSVWAAVRPHSKTTWLTDSRINFIHLPLNDENTLRQSLSTFKEKEGRWDYIIHAAGLTKARRKEDFMKVNYEGTRHLVSLLQELGMTPKQFVFISSLSVMGAPKEKPEPSGQFRYAPLCCTDEPQPNTAYGASKWAAEQYLNSLQDFPTVILRPTGVYGPREHDYFLLAQSIQRHIDFSVGFQPQEITFIYVKDLVTAAFLALQQAQPGQIFLLSDGNTYNSRMFSDLIQRQLGVKWLLRIKAPLWLLYVICQFGELMVAITHQPCTLNRDKYIILKQRNWRLDLTPALQLGFRPEYDLEAGVNETIHWYQQEKWI